MAALTSHVVPLQGLRYDNLLAAATSGGDDCQTGAGVLLVVKNADASPHTVTLAIPLEIDGDLQVPSRAVSVPAAATSLIPITDRYKNPSTGRAAITYDAVTSVTVAVIRVSTS